MSSVNYNIDMVAMLKPLMQGATAPLYQSLSKEIEALIERGHLKTGEKLTPQRVLAFDLEMTVATIAKAYSELERLGLVTVRKGDGTYVCSPQKKLGNDFRNVRQEKGRTIDLSQNTHINNVGSAQLVEVLSGARSAQAPLREGLANYVTEAGLLNHRLAGRKWLERSKVHAKVENIICTNGAQHALLCSIMATLRTGSAIAAEAFTYPGLLGICRTLGVKLIHIDMDVEGMLPDALAAACRKQHISAIYCMPTCQNPTTRKMTLIRRRQLVRVCKEHNLLIFEDEAHGILINEHPDSLYELAPERTFTFTGLSKGVSSGLRVGYLAVPDNHVQMLEATIRSTCWMATPIAHEIAARWIENGMADKLMQRHIREMTQRKSLVNEFVETLHYETSDSCAHYWIWIPTAIDCSDLVAELRHKGIIIQPSTSFTENPRLQQPAIRVCVSGPESNDDVTNGFRIIQRTLEQANVAK